MSSDKSKHQVRGRRTLFRKIGRRHGFPMSLFALLLDPGLSQSFIPYKGGIT